MSSIDSQQIDDLFNLFNTNTKGTIHASHLKNIYNLLKITPDKNQLARRVLDMDDGLGLFELTLDQLRILLQTVHYEKKESTNVDFNFICNILSVYDIQKNGFIMFEEFKQSILEHCDFRNDEMDDLVTNIELLKDKYIRIDDASNALQSFLKKI